MRKLLLTLLALVALLPASAASFTITFDSGTLDGSLVAKTKPENFISEGLDYIKVVNNASNVYFKKSEGIRFSTSSKNGVLDFTLNQAVKINSVVLNVKKWSASEVSTLKINGKTVEGMTGSAQDIEVVLDGTSTDNIKLEATKRSILKSLTINYGDGGEEPEPGVPTQPGDVVVKYNGLALEQGVVYEVAKSWTLDVASEGADEIRVTRDGTTWTTVENGSYVVEEDGIYGFTGVTKLEDGSELLSENVVSFTFEIDDLEWMTAVESEDGETAWSYDFTDLTSFETSTTLTVGPNNGNYCTLSDVVMTSGCVDLTVSDGTNPGRIHRYDGKTELRFYRNGGALNFSTKSGEAIKSIAVVMTDANEGSLYYNDVVVAYDSSSKTYTWVAPASEKCTSVSIAAGTGKDDKNVYIKGITVTVGGGVTYMVAAPVWMLNGEVLDCGGDVANAKEVKENDVIRIESHKRTHLHYSHNGDVVAANVKALMSAEDAEINWTPVTGDEKHVYEYVVPANLDHDVVMYAKAVKGDYEPVVTRLLLDANGTVTSIDGVGADAIEAAPEYFNLQGVRVANPSNGLFIKRTGNKVEKVMM